MEQIPHYDIVQEIVNEVSGEAGLLGILLVGSVARGDALPGSDIDLRFLVTTMDNSASFQTEIRRGIVVEKGRWDIAKAQTKLENDPMHVYPYLDGRILFDPTGAFARLTEEARSRFEKYRTPEDERKNINYWLKSANRKIQAALEVEDILRAAYLSDTQSWVILTGVWAVNDKPMPPSGSVWPHLKDLSRGPQDIEMRLQQLFLGETSVRIQTTIDLIDWITAMLDKDAEETGATVSFP
jgi:predicted nucleotidyltransferase